MPTCFEPTPYCCASAPCETAPGCPGAGSSCGDTEGDGRYDHCTFLSPCGDAGPPMRIDAGPPPPPDSGPVSDPDPDSGPDADAGPASDSGSVSDSDSGSASDSGSVSDSDSDSGSISDRDSGPVTDSGPRPMDTGPPRRPKDDGGCSCHIPSTSQPRVPNHWLTLLALLLFRRRAR